VKAGAPLLLVLLVACSKEPAPKLFHCESLDTPGSRLCHYGSCPSGKTCTTQSQAACSAVDGVGIFCFASVNDCEVIKDQAPVRKCEVVTDPAQVGQPRAQPVSGGRGS
jgi:hypothetical protein